MDLLRISRAALVMGCAISTTPALAHDPGTGDGTQPTVFAPADDAIPFEPVSRTVWGGPVVADLDGDGWPDIVTTEHGHAVRIYWNDEGTFSEPVRVIRGDTHGMGVEDIDGDGRMDLVISRGGGNGSNPRRPVHYIVNHDRSIEEAEDFSYFEPSRGRAVRFLDANRDGALDLFHTGFAPRNVPELTANQLYLNNDGELEFSEHLPHTRDALGFQVLSTDFNNDNIVDLLLYAGNDLVAVRGQPDGSFVDATETVLGPLNRTRQVSGAVEIDYDNDGDMDLFLSRAAKQFEEERYYDPETRRLAFFQFNNTFMFEDLEVDGDLVLDNVQETYATFGVFLGADRNEADLGNPGPHSGGRLAIRPQDAEGWPEGDLRGLHVGYLGDGMWRVGGMVQSRLAAVIENVVTVPATMERIDMPAMLLENRGGNYVDVTADLGIDFAGQTNGVDAGDFDNDGWVDLVLIHYGNMVSPLRHTLLMNNGGESFVRHDDTGLASAEIGAIGGSVAVIDFDRDGQLDVVYGNERGRWHLARNVLADGQIGNFLAVRVGPSPESGGAITDARLSITACGRTQVRKVGTNGDGFHHMANPLVHFGLGECNLVDAVELRWYNGETASVGNIDANQLIELPAD